MFIKWHLGRGNIDLKKEGRWFLPLTAAESGCQNGETYAKVKNINIVSGYSDQHGRLAGV